jgi:hypothetical protein
MITRLHVVCLPDAIIALPAPDTDSTESTMAPTRSFIKGHGCPAWIFSTSEELVTDSDDYNYVQRHLCFGLTPEGENLYYMERLQMVIKNAFINLEAQVSSGS